MQGKIYEIPLDISSGVLTQQIRQVVTEDMGTNTFRFKLVKDKHIPYPLTGTIVRMIAKTPSGARIQQECTIENAVAGTISLILKQSLILEPGSYIAEIQIYDEITQSIRLTTPTFDYHVRESLQNSDSIVATDEYTILQQALADLASINIVVANKADKSDVGDPEDLNTTEKANLVAAINEVKLQSNEKANQLDTESAIAKKGSQTDIDSAHQRIDALLIGSGDANAELTDSHVSIPKAKTYDTISERLNELESENFFPMTNLVTNGGFVNKTQWTSVGSAGTGGGSSIDSTKSLTGTTSLKIINVSGVRRETQTLQTVVGHEYYMKVHAHVNSHSEGTILLRLSGAQNIDRRFDSQELSSWQKQSFVFTADTSSMVLTLGAVNTATYDINFDGIIVLDLTEIFGAGNEPSVEDMDKLLEFYDVGWFDGTTSPNASVLKYNFESVLKSNKALDEHEIRVGNLESSTTNFKAKNLVVNGSFDGDKVGWRSFGVVGSSGITEIDSNVKLFGESSLKITNTESIVRETQTLQTVVGNKYYSALHYRLSSLTSGYIHFYGVGFRESINRSIIGSWQRYSQVAPATENSYTLTLGAVNTATYDINFDGIIVLDLTEIFGAGNEPSVEDMDAMLDRFHGGWFDGEVNPFIDTRSIFNYLNNKIIPQEEGVIMPVGYIDNPSLSDWTGQGMVTLSYDDGRMNNYDLALPLHEKHGIPVTFNVISSRFDSNLFFSEGVVRNCFNRGVEIASHSHYHNAPLTDKTDEEVNFEMSESKRLLNDAIGSEEVETIAIPYSNYDDRVKAIAQQYYKGVRVFDNTQNDLPPNDRYELSSRIAVGNTTTFEQLKSRIDEAVTEKKWCIIMLHGINNASNRSKYDITQKLLDQTLLYIRKIGRENLLPINTKDALKFSLGEDY